MLHESSHPLLSPASARELRRRQAQRAALVHALIVAIHVVAWTVALAGVLSGTADQSGLVPMPSPAAGWP